MYLSVNLQHQITTIGGLLLIIASHMTSHIVKYTVSLSHLLMRLHGPHIRSLLLFWQPVIP